jgi:polysaccharide export outer membrane protein
MIRQVIQIVRLLDIYQTGSGRTQYRQSERLACARDEELSVILSNTRQAFTICVSVVVAIGMVCQLPAEAWPQANPQAAADPARTVQEARESTPDNPTDPSLKLSPVATLRMFEPAANEEYTLGAGDEISIEYPGRPELATKSTIGPDGRITLPVVGPMVVTNLTREAAAQKIAAALLAYYTTNITATVEVVRYGSNHVTLLGNVKNPGSISFDQTPTLLEVLSRGGIETRPDGSLPDQCVIYRGDLVLWVDLQELLVTGSPLADLRLLRNDLIFVPAVTKTITVVGQVQHPGQIELRHDSTLTSILGEAGGVSDAAGNNPELQIVHRVKGGRTQYIRLKDLLKPTGGMEISLNAGDVIYVPKSGIAKTGFVMQQVAPFLTLGSLAAVAVH